MPELTVAEVAAKLGLHRKTVSRYCDELGLGRWPHPRMRLLTPGDVRKIKRHAKPVGNPNFGG